MRSRDGTGESMPQYYGWRIVGIALLFQLLIVGSSANAFGLFVIPVSEEFGLSRADMNTGLIISNLGGAAIAPFLGRLIDNYPVRKIIAICATVFCLGMVGLGLSHSVLLSALLLAVALPMGLAGVSQLGGLTLVARWFEAQRARAMALAIMGASLGSLIMAPIVGWLIHVAGWRNCLIIMGGCLLVILLSMILVVRDRPGPDDKEPQPKSAVEQPPAQSAQPASGKPMSARQILSMPLFWLLAGGVALAMGGFQTVMISLVPIAQEEGVVVTRAATLISVLGATAIVGKILLVWIGDRIDKALGLALTFGVLAGLFLALTVVEGYLALFISAGLLGLAVGATMPLFMALLADYVGPASFGSANGIAMLFMSASGAISMRFGGEVYDRTGGYDVMFIVFSAICVAATISLVVCRSLARGRAPGRQAAPAAE